MIDVVQEERREIGDAGRTSVDQEQRSLVDAGDLRTEPANPDSRQDAVVLHDIDARVLLERVRDVGGHGTLDVLRIDHFDLLRRLGEPRLHAASGHHHALDQAGDLQRHAQRPCHGQFDGRGGDVEQVVTDLDLVLAWWQIANREPACRICRDVSRRCARHAADRHSGARDRTTRLIIHGSRERGLRRHHLRPRHHHQRGERPHPERTELLHFVLSLWMSRARAEAGSSVP